MYLIRYSRGVFLFVYNHFMMKWTGSPSFHTG